MAKGFPYFKFTASEWLTGDIVFEDYDLQGIFINVCSLYWHRDGDVAVEDLEKRIKSDRLKLLYGRFILVNNDGKISIKFLDEQLIEANHISKVNSENGKKGGRPKGSKTLEKKPTAKRPISEPKPKKSKEEKEEEEEKEENKIPNFQEFITYCKTFSIYHSGYDFAIKAKYDSWIANGWKDGNDKPIKTWKTKIANTFPHLQPTHKQTEIKPPTLGYKKEDFI